MAIGLAAMLRGPSLFLLSKTTKKSQARVVCDHDGRPRATAGECVWEADLSRCLVRVIRDVTFSSLLTSEFGDRSVVLLLEMHSDRYQNACLGRDRDGNIASCRTVCPSPLLGRWRKSRSRNIGYSVSSMVVLHVGVGVAAAVSALSATKGPRTVPDTWYGDGKVRGPRPGRIPGQEATRVSISWLREPRVCSSINATN